MKKRLALLIALLAAVSQFRSDSLVHGSPTPVPPASYDQYGGVATASCTNPNGGKYFGINTVTGHKVLCDPAGHLYFGRGFYVFDFSTLGNDEAGGNYNSYVTAKFGNPPNYTWDTQEVARMKSWGFNMIGPEASAYALPFWPWRNGGTNPNKVPFVAIEEGCAYSWTNLYSWGTGPVKDLMGPRSPFWTGYVPAGGVTDYEDPAWANFVNGEAANETDFQGLVNASATDRSYLIAYSYCDADYTHGFEAGPDFDTQPTAGANDWRLSYAVALASPVEWGSTRQHEIYADPTVYSKKAFHDQLTAEYPNIATLNSAWGSSYTTFGTSGSCYGNHVPVWLCPSPNAAESIGTGDGSTLTFSHTLAHTTVSGNSLGIFVAGNLVGGDNGSGTLYGPSLSGSNTVNYSTGALTVTFASAPASGAAITAEYIANGWGTGTGLMDEDGRTAHQSWTGHNPICIDGVGTSAACRAGGGSPYASPGMVADLNTLDVTIAAHFGSVTKNAIARYFPGALYAGITTWATWMTPPNRYVLQGLGPYVDIMQSGGGGELTQAELDFIHQYAGDIAISYGAYNTANMDSPFEWPNSSCTHSGTTVTCTIATPENFSASWSIQAACSDSTYNVNGVRPTAAGTTSVSYSASTTPYSSSATCTVAFVDANKIGFSTQAARAQAVGSQMAALPSWSYSADGVHPYVMAIWWQWSDKQDEELSWGVVDTRDNAYNGVETTTAIVPCAAPLQAFSCGGELRGQWGSTDGMTPLINANAAIDNVLAGLVSTQALRVSGGADLRGALRW